MSARLQDPRGAGPPYLFRIGADENGLGARLGPLVVTAVLARVDASGARTLARRLPKRIAADLDDSKRLVAHGNVALGEAWARVLAAPSATRADDVLDSLLLEGREALRRPCPKGVAAQCWASAGDDLSAPEDMLARVTRHLETLRGKGVEVCSVRSSVTCTRLLNDAKAEGLTRFSVDLHAMERLVLTLRAEAGADVHATCGKVGGIGEYSRFFGPLSDRLHAIIAEKRPHSAYRFPGLGELHFIQDADAKDPLVMLASLVGKWVRELLMARIVRFYANGDDEVHASGYNDPVSARFVKSTRLARRKRSVPDTCFERVGADG